MKTLFAWIPQAHRRSLLQRLCIVWAVSLPIALIMWMGRKSDGLPHRLDVSLVYAFAISTCIWLLTDVARFACKGPLRARPPHYWPPVTQASVMLLVGIPVGYALGTGLGDAYAGASSWDDWHLAPLRFVVMLGTSVAISVAYVAYFYQRSKAERLAQEVTQSQLLLLQSQLEPHMLFNTLAHLRALIGQDTARAHAMLDHLNDYLRTTLQASRQPLHPLAEEFSRLGDYLHLMAIRMGPRLVFALDLPPALATAAVPSFILQPLVENAIRHGLEPVVAGGSIAVQAHAAGGQLLLTVRDNGCGISTLALAASASTARASSERPAASWGLAHVRQRLHTLYGSHASLHISPSASGGTCAVLTLPLTPFTTTSIPTTST